MRYLALVFAIAAGESRACNLLPDSVRYPVVPNNGCAVTWTNPCHTHAGARKSQPLLHCWFGYYADLRVPEHRAMSAAQRAWANYSQDVVRDTQYRVNPPPWHVERYDCVNGAGWKSYDKLKGCHAEALQAYDERTADWRRMTEADYPMDHLDLSQTPWWWPERANGWLPPMPDLDAVWAKLEYVEAFGFWPPEGRSE